MPRSCGQKAMPARAFRVLAAEEAVFGYGLGKYYVVQHFSPEVKAKAVVMIERLRTALREDLSTLAWMSPEGRQAAGAVRDVVSHGLGTARQSAKAAGAGQRQIPAGGRAGDGGDGYFSCEASELKKDESCGPTLVTPARIMIESRLAISAYSMAVAPRRSAANRLIRDRAAWGSAASRPRAWDTRSNPPSNFWAAPI